MALKLNKNFSYDIQVRARFGDVPVGYPLDILPSRAAILASRQGNPPPSPSPEAYAGGRNESLEEEKELSRQRVLNPFQYLERQSKGNYITIVDLDYDPSIDNSKRPRSFTLPFVPREVDFNPESTFPVIPALGRNLPRYQFTGAEDTVEFSIDWLAEEDNRKDVLRACKWIEALTKANGYSDDPHRVLVVWGENPIMFRDVVFIIVKAPYQVRRFQRGHMTPDHYNRNSANYRKGDYIDTNLLPNLATQKLTLKRVSDDNLTSDDILDVKNLYS